MARPMTSPTHYRPMLPEPVACKADRPIIVTSSRDLVTCEACRSALRPPPTPGGDTDVG